MINFSKEIVSALSAILPTFYEMALTNTIKTPCISYMELSNIEEVQGDTLGYSRIQYQVKVWSTKLSDLEKYSLLIDATMRKKGFQRRSGTELFDSNSMMKQKVMVYEIYKRENY